MKYLSLLLFIFSLSLFAQENVEKKNIDLAIGIDELIKLDYKWNNKFEFGQDGLIDVIQVPARGEITFRGKTPGKTSVTIRDNSGEIRDVFLVNVTADGNSNIVKELRELIGDIEGIEINIKGGKVIVEGEIVVPEAYGRIAAVLTRYPDVMVLVQYSRQTQLIIAREMQDAINRNGMKDVTVRVVNGDYWLEGVVNSQGKKVLAKSISEAYLPDKLLPLAQVAGGPRVLSKERGSIVDFISVNEQKDPEPPKKLIKVTSQFVELSKDYLKVFAFKWAPLMSNRASLSFGRTDEGGVATSEDGTLSGTISSLFPQLNSAKQAGYARVIQSGMGVTNDGQQVRINKATQINFAIGTGQGQESKTANINFTMTTTPQIQTEENIQLNNLSVSVSLPNTSSTGGTALVTTNEVNTQITVKNKESAVIGGIMQNASSTNYDKDDPSPTNIQAGNDSAEQSSQLFRLLRSKSYNTTKNQFVVFVTPEILESASKGSEEIRRKFRRRER